MSAAPRVEVRVFGYGGREAPESGLGSLTRQGPECTVGPLPHLLRASSCVPMEGGGVRKEGGRTERSSLE
jgi:hypothetical protein